MMPAKGVSVAEVPTDGASKANIPVLGACSAVDSIAMTSGVGLGVASLTTLGDGSSTTTGSDEETGTISNAGGSDEETGTMSATGGVAEGAPLAGALDAAGYDAGGDFSSFGTDLQIATKVQRKNKKQKIHTDDA
jgi:hypothetical protein